MEKRSICFPLYKVLTPQNVYTLDKRRRVTSLSFVSILLIFFISAPSQAKSFREICDLVLRGIFKTSNQEADELIDSDITSPQTQMSKTEAYELVVNVNNMRSDPNFNIETTHVPWLFGRMSRQLGNLEEFAKESLSPKKGKVLEEVEKLKQELLEVFENKRLTYLWFLKNSDLIPTLYQSLDEADLYPIDLSKIREELSYMIEARTSTGGLGEKHNLAFMDMPVEEATPIPIMNALFVGGVLPNWITRSWEMTDGSNGLPRITYYHDISHNRDIREFLGKDPQILKKLKKVHAEIQLMDEDRREVAEIIFFRFTHEHSSAWPNLAFEPELIRLYIRDHYNKELRKLLPKKLLRQSYEDVAKYIMETTSMVVALYKKAESI